jgi:hypothetical protein
LTPETFRVKGQGGRGHEYNQSTLCACMAISQ